MNLRKIKRLLRALTPEQLLNLDTWLHELISAETAVPARAMGRRETVKEHKASRRTYRLEGIRCGKERCKCASGNPHGPYWYAYWTESGRTKSQYIGKRLPAKNKR
jgi:hypothetical protein